MTGAEAVAQRKDKLYFSGALGLVVAFIVQSLVSLYVSATLDLDTGIVLFFASVSMLALLAPFILRWVPFDLFSPLTFILLSFLMGTGGRIPFIILNYEHVARARFLMFNMTFEQVAQESVWFFVGVVFLVFGYISTHKRLNLFGSAYWLNYQFNQGRFFVVCLTFGALGSVFGLIFLRAGGIDLSDGDILGSSQKIHVGTKESVGLLGGISRQVVSFAIVPFLCLASFLVTGKLKANPFVLAALVLLAMPVFGVPFIASSRGGIITSIISIGIFVYYFKGLNPVKLLVVLLGVLMLIQFMGALRIHNKSVNIQVEKLGLVGSVLGSGNGVDMVRTAGIIYYVPERTDYLYGKSYLALLTFGVPRAIWPEKPEVGLGPLVKSEVFGGREVDKNGWPAGIVGEAYLNFGRMGLVFVMFLYGAMQRLIYNSFRPHLGSNFPATIIYACLVYRFSFSTTNLNFAHGISGLFVLAAPLLLFFVVCRKYEKTS